MSIPAKDVKALRDRTGAGMMDCKRALTETAGDIESAIDVLRAKGTAKAAKRAEKSANEGAIGSYVHFDNRTAVIVELNCETDFVARSHEFRDFAYEVALHIAAAAPLHVGADEISDEAKAAERRVFEQAARADGKPDDVVERIVDGQLAKWTKGVVLLEQEHVNTDKHDGSTIEELRAALAARVGENVRIARFARFLVGDEA